MLKIPTDNKIAVTYEFVEAENYLSKAFLLKPAPPPPPPLLPLGRSAVPVYSLVGPCFEATLQGTQDVKTSNSLLLLYRGQRAEKYRGYSYSIG